MASTTPAKPPSRPPPPKVAEKTSKTPPARPANGPTNKQVETKEKLAATNVKVCTDSDWASQKAKVVEEMVASETTYLMDLTCWENASTFFSSSNHLNFHILVYNVINFVGRIAKIHPY
jgi:hypothetical protein